MGGALRGEPPPVRVRAGPEHAGTRLDVFVGAMASVGSRSEAQRLIDAGRVTVNGGIVKRRHALAGGDEVHVRPLPAPRTELVPEEMPLTVLYVDEHVIVVDKPAGVVTHPSRGHETGTVVHGLLALGAAGGEDPSRPGIVHRLDRDTSGLMVVARTPQAHRRLGRLMRERRIERRYLALVHGSAPPAVTIDRPVGRDRRVRTRMSTVTDTGREAVTHVRRLEHLGAFSLVEARLETGRTHQIRVHLEAVGLPVVGDPVYGRRPEALGLSRQFLHAAYLAFPHPETGEPIRIESPLPSDLAAALDEARRRGVDPPS
ncbi:MAG TPA: RluA family pseudouridine synthase [Methylomirabilota bacterium]|nr:RluA family pseudouridine synthase [Methylomirabilota bacterium]